MSAVWQIRSPLGGPQRAVTSPFPFLKLFGEKWGEALWGLQHSFQAMEKLDVKIQMELRA